MADCRGISGSVCCSALIESPKKSEDFCLGSQGSFGEEGLRLMGLGVLGRSLIHIHMCRDPQRP